ncbi:uncharacterized protein YndB with AHSA1/START domain [Nitrosospira sp. Nsp5]|uniref:Uncharacterized conserved protein YndB, AHSA1/START domain n=1 Tax=Nitrosospira multiformis TaxID=1231 RepID=A0ABY0TFH2_9PROT|nr:MULTISPECIES: SRPBCC domain-containing protein [Nitrosospira]PTR10788.1 uncharacterized protein YndB with AHSA1/START domain [Nitrosospira sp. Nsp5]SDQ74999.1 Uncharacterized conserved protein YndB, AHSA1/START domain [Nitrosospira multiformis]
MSEKNEPAAASAERILVITRIFDAPRSLVFKAWTQPEHLAHWCCPRGFTTPFHQSDIRPGGAWRVCMRSPEGKDYWVRGFYREIVEPEQLVFTHTWEDAEGKPDHETLVTVSLTEHDGKTTQVFRQAIFKSVENRDSHEGGWNESFDNLADYLVQVSRHGK